MSADEFSALLSDMAKNGYDKTAPIILCEGKILDGRNRYRAAEELGVIPVYQDFVGDDPLEFVIRHNLIRRHLNESQRAIIAGRLANMTRLDTLVHRVEGGGYRSANLQNDKVSQSSAADMLNVSPRMVASAKAIEREAPELIPAIEAGEKNINQVMREIRRDRQIEGVKEIQPPKGKYQIIYADPPWQYQFGFDIHGAALRHYNTMSIPELCELPIKELSEENSVLFMWATSPKLEDAFMVMNAWGFEYKTSFVWDKVKHVMGHYNSVRHELLLIGVRGSFPKQSNTLIDSVVTIERSDEHSEKPERFREIIDDMYPFGERIELFARKKVDGWNTWGSEL